MDSQPAERFNEAVKFQQMKEQQVLLNELSTLRKNAKVYKQQPNSQVFFLADKDQCKKECKKQLEGFTNEKKGGTQTAS